MDAILIAGGIPQPEDPLYNYSNGRAKALINVAGKPMVQWVLDALNDSSEVDNIIVAGLHKNTRLDSSKPLHFISDQGRALPNVVAGIKKSIDLGSQGKYVLVVSSAIPAIKSSMIDGLVVAAKKTKGGIDINYSVCRRNVMEARFPNSRKTYWRFGDGDICLGGMYLIRVDLLSESPDMEALDKLIEEWKNPYKLSVLIGFGTFLLYSSYGLTSDELNSRVSKFVRAKCYPVVWQKAEPCMVVDDPLHLEIAHDDLTSQKRKAAAQVKKSSKVKKEESKPAEKIAQRPSQAKTKDNLRAKSEKSRVKPSVSKRKKVDVVAPVLRSPAITALLTPENWAAKQTENVRWKLKLQNTGGAPLQSLVLKRGGDVIEQVQQFDLGQGAQVEFLQSYDLAGIEREIIDITAVTKSGETLSWQVRGEIHIQRDFRVFAGMEFTLIPKGSFIMGSKPDKADAFDDEKPRHPVELQGNFWMGRYPITNSQFARFIEASGYRTTAETKGSGTIFTGKWPEGLWEEVPKANWRKPFGKKRANPDRENHPVTLVSWHDAQEYCRWLNQEYKSELPVGLEFRLPTEAEWEKAARGEDALEYPWGNRLPEVNQINADRHVGDLTPVGKYSPQSDSPFGAADMAGNVWEWTNSIFQGYPYRQDDGREDPNSPMPRVLRGGSFLNTYSSARCASRSSALPETCISYYGFRVVVAPPVEGLMAGSNSKRKV
jgi:formylglycine-generating enzyme required for sulfatase activity/GTP:adenosylcobinamide-phosphate guanylyltransferase